MSTGTEITSYHDCESLDDFLGLYGDLIAQRSSTLYAPLHTPTDKPPFDDSFVPSKYKPFPAQAHVAYAGKKVLDLGDPLMISAKMGCGKTKMSLWAARIHAQGRPFRAIALVPDHIIDKWCDEVHEALGTNVDVVKIRDWAHMNEIARSRPSVLPHPAERGEVRTKNQWPDPPRPVVYVLGRDKSKYEPNWEPSCGKRRVQYRSDRGVMQTVIAATCPKCGAAIVDKDDVPQSYEDIRQKRKKLHCEAKIHVLKGEGDEAPEWVEVECGERLWTYHGRNKGKESKAMRKWAPARIIQKKLRWFFDYAIIDEAHEYKSDESIRGNAMGSIVAAAKNVIILTGTIINGYANSIMAIMFRIRPGDMIRRGFDWGKSLEFSEAYGKIDTIATDGGWKGDAVQDKEGEVRESLASGRGSVKAKVRRIERPGIMPRLFTDLLLPYTVFLDLPEIAAGLPGLIEEAVPVPLSPEQEVAYWEVHDELKATMDALCQKGNPSLCGAYMATTLQYPDCPWDWKDVGYHDKELDSFIPVVRPPDLDKNVIYPKEQRIIDDCLALHKEGRQTWIFIEQTQEHDVGDRLAELIGRTGLRAKVLRQSTVSREKRLEWIAKQGRSVDVMISQPTLVETGVDLFSKKPGGHNYSAILFYEQPTRLTTLRQASRRSYRIGQQRDCVIKYYYYVSNNPDLMTMADRMMALNGQKLAAAINLEGDFSEEGLAAMASGEESPMAMVRNLSRKMDSGARAWAKISVSIHKEEPIAFINPTPTPAKPIPIRPVNLMSARDLKSLFTKLRTVPATR